MLPSTRVWNVAEIKLRILSQVHDRKDLASLLRTEKRGMALAAGFLYYEMTCEHVRSGMSQSTDRQKMYENAITVLDCREFSLTPSMIRKLHLDTDHFDFDPQSMRPPSMPSDSGSDSDSYCVGRTRVQEAQIEARARRFVATYSPEVLQVLLPTLRTQLPGLRKLIFGRAYRPFSRVTSWIVELDREDLHQGMETEAGAGDGGSGTGQIEHFQTLVCWVEQAPPGKLPITPLPPPGFMMSARWDLDLSPTYVHPPNAAEEAAWTTAFQSNPLFPHLYRAVNLARLPISLPDLTGLFQRQIDAGYTDRLHIIEAPFMAPFDLQSFEAFADVASNSLTHLHLAEHQPIRSCSTIHPASLSGLIRIVGDSLPHLVSLHFRLDELEEAEGCCGSLLRPDMLCRTGSIADLQIHTRHTRIHPFNALRVLSPILAKSAAVSLVGVNGVERFLTRYLKYLRDAFWTPRLHLATLDFSFLGIDHLESLFDLTFDDCGFPEHRLVTFVDQQLATSNTNFALKRGRVIPHYISSHLHQARARLADATRLLIVMSESLLSEADIPETMGRIKAQVQVQRRVQGGAVEGIEGFRRAWS